MKFLLDTHLLLWAAGQPERLPKPARKLIENPDNELHFSAASIWEIAMKSSLGREDFKADSRLVRRGLIDNGYREISISSEHAAGVQALPLVHKDPFDRLLIAQSLSESMPLVTVDPVLSQYPGLIQQV
ncbi:MAG: type II toxin-antitoxin system VapC family toxin [Betaproteobacteria bacterium]|nr:type II toxin-antitoxin system VapC family toxin [Betaproteobacteria bacterium]